MEEKIIEAFSKLINSDVVKTIYPMIDHIDIVSLKYIPFVFEYDLSINIFLNDPNINRKNMYAMNFDPHYLVSKHLKNLSKYFDITLRYTSYKLYSPDGELLLDWG